MYYIFTLALTRSTRGWVQSHKTIQPTRTLPTNCQIQVNCFWLISYKSEVPTTSASSVVSTLERLTELRKTCCLLDITQEQPDERYRRLRYVGRGWDFQALLRECHTSTSSPALKLSEPPLLASYRGFITWAWLINHWSLGTSSFSLEVELKIPVL